MCVEGATYRDVTCARPRQPEGIRRRHREAAIFLPGAGVARVVAIEPPWHVHRREMDRKQKNESERNNSTDAIKVLEQAT